MALATKNVEASNPVPMRFLRAEAVALEPDPPADAVEQESRRFRLHGKEPFGPPMEWQSRDIAELSPAFRQTVQTSCRGNPSRSAALLPGVFETHFTLGPLRMPIEHALLRKTELHSPKAFVEVERVAGRFLDFLNQTQTQKRIAVVHKLGASSVEVQKAILPGATELGFTPEKKGLFRAYAVPALRPDYFLKVKDTGILLEVERGKTTTNNMDLLDFWKCHICEDAEYLFLLVPQARPSENGRVMRHFKQVHNRLREGLIKPSKSPSLSTSLAFGDTFTTYFGFSGPATRVSGPDLTLSGAADVTIPSSPTTAVVPSTDSTARTA